MLSGRCRGLLRAYEPLDGTFSSTIKDSLKHWIDLVTVPATECEPGVQDGPHPGPRQVGRRHQAARVRGQGEL